MVLVSLSILLLERDFFDINELGTFVKCSVLRMCLIGFLSDKKKYILDTKKQRYLLCIRKELKRWADNHPI